MVKMQKTNYTFQKAGQAGISHNILIDKNTLISNNIKSRAIAAKISFLLYAQNGLIK